MKSRVLGMEYVGVDETQAGTLKHRGSEGS